MCCSRPTNNEAFPLVTFIFFPHRLIDFCFWRQNFSSRFAVVTHLTGTLFAQMYIHSQFLLHTHTHTNTDTKIDFYLLDILLFCYLTVANYVFVIRVAIFRHFQPSCYIITSCQGSKLVLYRKYGIGNSSVNEINCPKTS